MTTNENRYEILADETLYKDVKDYHQYVGGITFVDESTGIRHHFSEAVPVHIKQQVGKPRAGIQPTAPVKPPLAEECQAAKPLVLEIIRIVQVKEAPAGTSIYEMYEESPYPSSRFHIGTLHWGDKTSDGNIACRFWRFVFSRTPGMFGGHSSYTIREIAELMTRSPEEVAKLAKESR